MNAHTPPPDPRTSRPDAAVALTKGALAEMLAGMHHRYGTPEVATALIALDQLIDILSTLNKGAVEELLILHLQNGASVAHADSRTRNAVQALTAAHAEQYRAARAQITKA